MYLQRQAAIEKTLSGDPLLKLELSRLHKMRSRNARNQFDESTQVKSRLDSNVSIKSPFTIPKSSQPAKAGRLLHVVVMTEKVI